MINDREKMARAEMARRTMAIHYREGLKMFKDLFDEFGEDGMFYFKRANEYEYREKYRLALKDYQAAVRLFYMETWKQKAREGVGRCNLHLSGDKKVSTE